jgi:hypothetical protein
MGRNALLQESILIEDNGDWLSLISHDIDPNHLKSLTRPNAGNLACIQLEVKCCASDVLSRHTETTYYADLLSAH